MVLSSDFSFTVICALNFSFIIYLVPPYLESIPESYSKRVFFNLQSAKSKEKLRKELRKELAGKEDQLKKELAEKDTHISINSKHISDLQQQLKNVSSLIYSVQTDH